MKKVVGANLGRRTVLRGMLGLGGAPALAGCGTATQLGAGGVEPILRTEAARVRD
jgi:hypothetical protein